MKLDNWQKEVLSTKGNLVLCSGRQVGKSTIIAMKAGEYAVNNPNKMVLVIASVERQAFLLFEKVLSYIHDNYKNMIKKGKDRPTKATLRLKNGSQIRCVPTGLSGYGIRGFTIDQLYADEAAFIPEDVWSAVTPMLATTGGDIILLSTPHGREGYFYRCFSDDSFTKLHISSEECDRIPKDFLEKEKERMSKLQYAQEYLGQFLDELRQFFPDDVIKKSMLLSRSQVLPPVPHSKEFFLGVDVARMGSDETTYEIVQKMENNDLYHRENIVKTKELTTMTSRFIIHLDSKYNFKRIFIDDGGLGAGVFDQCLEDPQTRRKVVAINNLRKSIEHKPFGTPRKRKMMKEELYDNLLRLMEQGKIKLLDDPEIYQSFKSVQYEYGRDERGEGKIRIYGNYTHIVEGLIRAAWCVKDKTLKLWVQYI